LDDALLDVVELLVGHLEALFHVPGDERLAVLPLVHEEVLRVVHLEPWLALDEGPRHPDAAAGPAERPGAHRAEREHPDAHAGGEEVLALVVAGHAQAREPALADDEVGERAV